MLPWDESITAAMDSFPFHILWRREYELAGEMQFLCMLCTRIVASV